MTDFLHFAYRTLQLHKPASVQTRGTSASEGESHTRRGDGIATAAIFGEMGEELVHRATSGRIDE
jgi:hypothetical protein